MNDDTTPPAPTKGPGRKQSAAKPSIKDARRQLADIKAKEEERRLEEQYAQCEGQDWFLRCRVCSGVALFLTRYPIGCVVHPDMWYSDYRDLDTKYIADHIDCQECGQSQQVQFPSGIRGPWIVNERFVQSIADMEKRQRAADRQRSEATAMQVAKVSIMEGEG